MSNEMKITEFFENEFPDFAGYNLYRMVASYVDGLKPSQRKIVHTAMKNNIKSSIKVSQLASKVAEETQYLHGEDNLTSVVVTMAQNFPGTNNMPIIWPESSFGNRCFPEAAAGRYIFTRKSDYFDSIFDPKDTPLLTGQVFEGDNIEPLFFIPTLPMILINGSSGIGSAYAQKILPRNPTQVEKAVRKYLSEGKLPTARLAPFYKGYKGKISHIEGNSWEIRGLIEKKNSTTIMVTELPIGITLDKYTEELVKMEEAGTITTFTDYSDPGENNFLFEVKVTRAGWQKKTDEQILRDLKLIKRVTENFTCIDENNQVREFKDEKEILLAYIKIRSEFYAARKEDQLQKTDRKMVIARNRVKFITNVGQGKLDLYNKSEGSITCKMGGYDKVDDSYDYLLKMPIHSFGKEKIKALKEDVKKLEAEYAELKKKSQNDLWLEDLDNGRK